MILSYAAGKVSELVQDTVIVMSSAMLDQSPHVAVARTSLPLSS